MQSNVIYGAFGQTRAPTTAADTNTLARLDENTPTTLSNRIHASLNVLKDLSELVEQAGLPKEAADPIRTRLTELQNTANALAMKLLRAHTDDRVFLEVQPNIVEFGQQLVAFEADVMHKTGAELELVETPPPPVLSQVRAALTPTKGFVNSPKFWVGLSVGVAALSGLVWWGFHKEKPTKEDFTGKVQRVKLRRALAAR
jgi:hypothetical protein